MPRLSLACVLTALLGLPWAGVPGARAAGTNEEIVLTLAACLARAQAQSARMRVARLEREQARATVVQARAEALPHLSLNGQYRRMDELQEVDFGGQRFELGTLDNYSVEAGVRQTLYSGGRVNAALKASRLAGRLAAESEADATAGVVRDVHAGFAACLLSDAAVQVREASLEQLESLLRQTAEKFRSGTVPELDVLSAQVSVNNERPLLIEARRQGELAREQFRRLLWLDPGPYRLAGTLACEPVTVQLEDVLAAAQARRPALQRLETQVALRAQDVAASRSGALPNVYASAAYNGANSYQMMPIDKEWLWHWNAGVTLEWNLWDGNLTAGVIAEKRLAWEKSRTELADARRGVELEVRSAYLGLRRAAEAVEASTAGVALAERALAAAQSRYAAGLATYLDVTQANLGLNAARLNRLQALHDHMVARADLVYAGGGDGEGVAAGAGAGGGKGRVQRE